MVPIQERTVYGVADAALPSASPAFPGDDDEDDEDAEDDADGAKAPKAFEGLWDLRLPHQRADRGLTEEASRVALEKRERDRQLPVAQ